jgi:tetratricopeptide (TPR) repeat protein
MQNEHYIDEVLDAVVKNKLPETQAEFILREQQIPDVEATITLHRAAAAAVRRSAIQVQLQGVHREYLLRLPAVPEAGASEISMAPVRRITWKPILRVAAVLVLVLSGWLTLRFASTNGDRMYGEIYQPFTLDTERGIDEGATTDILDRFRAMDYPGVIASFAKISEPSNRDRFLAAYAMQSTGDFQQSIGLLRDILAQNARSGSMFYQDEAEFYLGLALIRVKAYKEAVDIFSAILNDPDHTYHTRVNRWMLTRLRWLT